VFKNGIKYEINNNITNVPDKALTDQNDFTILDIVFRNLDFFQNRVVIPLLLRGSLKKHYTLLSGLIGEAHNKIILDIACGPGSFIPFINEDNYYIGLDVSYYQLQQAMNRIREKDMKQYQLVMANAQNLPFIDNCIDHVTCNMALHFMPDYKVTINEIYRVLKKGRIFSGCVPVVGKNRLFDYIWCKISKKTPMLGKPFSEKEL